MEANGRPQTGQTTKKGNQSTVYATLLQTYLAKPGTQKIELISSTLPTNLS